MSAGFGVSPPSMGGGVGVRSCSMLVQAHCSPCKHTRGCRVPSSPFGAASLLGPSQRLFPPVPRWGDPVLGLITPPSHP